MASHEVADRDLLRRKYREERKRRLEVGGAIQNMFDFIEQGIVSPRDTDFTTRLAKHVRAVPTSNRRSY